MIGKIILITIILFFSTAAFALGGGQICFSRQENGGVMNIRLAEITVNGKHVLWIRGGENKCIDIKPGKYTIIAQSSDPYDPYDEKSDTWKSKPLILNVMNDNKVNIDISPISSEGGYSGPWLLKKQ